MIEVETPWGLLVYTEPVGEMDEVQLGGRTVLLGSAIAHTNGALLDFLDDGTR